MYQTANIEKYLIPAIKNTNTISRRGKVKKVIGLVLESEGPKAPIGEICELRNRYGELLAYAEIVGFRDDRILSMVLGDITDIEPSTDIIATGHTLRIGVGDKLLGRVIDGLGRPLDGKGELQIEQKRSIYSTPPNPLLRKRISEAVATGIRAIDGVLTFAKGQRVGIFAGSGVGKSTLIGSIARNTSADVNVIALIGERGREVREFLEKDLKREGLDRSVVVVATSDVPPLIRVKAALTATTIAEYFRDKGLDVMLMMDSATRLAMAQREVGLSIGEPPTTRGYTPSVFTMLQKTLERAGTSEKGSITGIYTVLVEGDDMNEPIADTTRGILDGHIVLSRKLASLGHYPAIDVLESISRCRNDVVSKEHLDAAKKIQEIIAIYRSAEDLISVGAYQKGTNPKIDKAMEQIDNINNFLRQEMYERMSYEEIVNKIIELSKM